MTHVPALTVGVVEDRERRLEHMLRQSGLRATPLSSDDVAALARPAAQPPPVIVVDVRTIALPPSLAQVTRQHPTTRVVIVAPELEPALMLSAMRAGASECVAEPVTGGRLLDAISRVASGGAHAALGRVFAFVGAKGGVGTTTLAVNVATVLARVATGGALLIDLQAGSGDAALYLGAEPKFTAHDALSNTHRLDDALFRGLVVRTEAGLDLLAAPHARSAANDQERIRALVAFAQRHFQFTVLDMPRADLTALDAFETGVTVVVVASQELAPLRTATRLAAALRRTRQAESVKVVVARHDALSEIAPEDVERAVGGCVRVLPGDYRRALAAANRGRPLVLDNHNRLAGSLVDFARELAELRPQPASPGRTGGLFDRLVRRMSR